MRACAFEFVLQLALLQPLQPAAELEEALELSRLARKICGGGGAGDDDANFNDASAVDIDAGAGAFESMLERWRARVFLPFFVDA